MKVICDVELIEFSTVNNRSEVGYIEMRDYTEIIFILDRSGSMMPLQAETIDSFNNFLKSQQAQKDGTKLTLVTFNTSYNIIYDGIDVNEIEPLTYKTYDPRGSTALIDTCCFIIDKVGQRLSMTPEKKRPSKVLVVILTDGYENASCKFNKEDMIGRIELQKNKYNWEFLYLGANQDSFAEATKYKIDHGYNYIPSPSGVRNVFCMMSSTIDNYKTTGKIDFKNDENICSK